MGSDPARRRPPLVGLAAGLVAGCLAVAAAGGGRAGAYAQGAAPTPPPASPDGDRQVVAAPRGSGETAVDVRAGATVVLDREAFAGATLAVDDDDLVVALPGGRTLILGGFFARGPTPARLAVGDGPPVPADELAVGGDLGRVLRPAPPPQAASPGRPAVRVATAPPRVGLPGGPIRRVVKFVDGRTPELRGFGAYAYVLLPEAEDPAGEELLAAMFAWERRARSDAPAGRRVTFYLPVRDAAAARRAYDEAMPAAAPDRREGRAWRRAARRLLASADIYDHARAIDVLRGLCGPGGAAGPPLCRGIPGGPYLLVTELPLSRSAPAPGHFLVDLAGHGAAGLERWVVALAGLTVDGGASGRTRLGRVRAAVEALAAGPGAVFPAGSPP